MGRTRAKDDRIPEHDVVGARAARDAPRRIRREALEVPNQAALAVGGLYNE